MTLRQRLLKIVYPVFMHLTKKKGAGILSNLKNTHPSVSFYSLQATLNSGKILDFSTLKGKKVMLVNTASNCGYTNQYTQLQQLHQQHGQSLVIIGFPANDFKEQETGTDTEIEQFCKVNFGVSFTLVRKSSVVNGSEQNPVFTWLTQPQLNGWNSQQPAWNFSKYLVNEQGVLVNYFSPGISPLSPHVIKAVTE
jgi:glutathione peroxidase